MTSRRSPTFSARKSTSEEELDQPSIPAWAVENEKSSAKDKQVQQYNEERERIKRHNRRNGSESSLDLLDEKNWSQNTEPGPEEYYHPDLFR